MAGRFGNFFSEKKLHEHVPELNVDTRALAMVPMNNLFITGTAFLFFSEFPKLSYFQ